MLQSAHRLVSSNESEAIVAVKTKILVQEPSVFKVILHNDDYTPMDFVVLILMKIFHKKKDIAESIMMEVHEKGRGICGVYPLEIAEMKVSQVIQEAKKSQHPLKCTLEKN